jgi:hypothetical protein
MVGTVKKSMETILFTWLSRKVLQVREGGLLPRTIHLLTLVSPMSISYIRVYENHSLSQVRDHPAMGFALMLIRSMSMLFH